MPRTFTKDTTVIFNEMMQSMKGGMIGQTIFDTYTASTQVFICIVTGFIYCLLFIGLMSCFAEPICYLCLVITELGLIGLPVVLGMKWQ